jgi:hypothetical protein
MTRFTKTVMHVECSKAGLLECQKEFVVEKLFDVTIFKMGCKTKIQLGRKKENGVRNRNTETFCQRWTGLALSSAAAESRS